MWSATDINWNQYSDNYEGLFFKEIIIGDGLRTASVADLDYWEDFTSADSLWENFTTQTWGGTVFTEVTI